MVHPLINKIHLGPKSKPYVSSSPKNDQGPVYQMSESREAGSGSTNSHRSRQAPQTEEPFRGMLLEDAGSSHDLTTLCPVTEPLEKVQQLTTQVQPFTARTEMKTITINASYRENIIIFRVDTSSGIVILEEVAKRLKLDVGTFDIKYGDDDHEWVLIVCDADLQECVELSISSGCNVIRLLVRDLSPNLESSCDSAD